MYTLLLFQDAFGKEIFRVEDIEQYLTKKNPYVYTAVGQQYIDAAHVTTSQGVFDTTLSASYDKKEYPVSTGEFFDVSLNKPTENGTEWIVGYRKAEGIQEYNNIKTGSQGEFRMGVKVPVFSLLNHMNNRKYTVESATINATKSRYDAGNNLRNLYAHITTTYYQLLYFNELLKLEKGLLRKAKKRDQFIAKKVKTGDFPEIAMLESQQQIITRQQRVLGTKSSYYKALQIFLKYINLSKNTFDKRYTLPSIKTVKKEKVVLEALIRKALKNRPDLKALEYKKMKLDLNAQYNTLSKYPDLNIFAYGVHDMKYGQGVKVGLQFDIPLERRKYEGKKVEIQRGLTQLKEEQNKLKRELKTNLTQLVYALDIANKNIHLGKKEIRIATKLEDAENKKYKLGSSDLFQVNQREITALQVKQKQLEYYINAWLIQQEIKKEIGEFNRL
ncbi:MAG TPA: hypothetical protein ENK98_05640 [Epsilonproteobacteria bacterium]|nr:hypothetical protein [Campylobacterota bacterium]